MFDWHAHIRETAAHLLWMASIPGAADHAKFRRDELLANPMYGEELRREIIRQQRSSSPSHATS